MCGQSEPLPYSGNSDVVNILLDEVYLRVHTSVRMWHGCSMSLCEYVVQGICTELSAGELPSGRVLRHVQLLATWRHC